MDNVDDEYALSSGNLSLFWSVAADGIYNQAGEKVGNIPYYQWKQYGEFCSILGR